MSKIDKETHEALMEAFIWQLQNKVVIVCDGPPGQITLSYLPFGFDGDDEVGQTSDRI